MARHSEILNTFKEILSSGFSDDNEGHRSMVGHVLLQCSVGMTLRGSETTQFGCPHNYWSYT